MISFNDYTLLFVDDGSIDHTLAKVKAISKFNPRINYLSFSRNFGHQAALKAGYAHAGDADIVITMDAAPAPISLLQTSRPDGTIYLGFETLDVGLEI